MKRSKLIYIIGSITLGVVALLCVLFSLIMTGVIDATQTKLVFSSPTANFVYDGKVHQNKEWKLSDGTLKKGHTAKVTITGRQVDVGISDNFISVVIVDSNGADVTVYYDIAYDIGKLKVTPRPISITSGSKSKVYDGTPLTYTIDDEAYTVSDGELVTDHKLEVTYTNSITDAGKVVNAFAPKISDSKGNDKTSNYALTLVTGILEVQKRQITISSNNDTKEYDGTPLTNAGYTIDDTRLLEGHKEVVEVIGSVVDFGKVTNTFNAKIVNANGEDVTKNYDITKDDGILTIEKRRIVIESEKAQKEYDGTPLVKDGYNIVDGEVLENHILTIKVTGSRTEVGESSNEFTYSILDEYGNDVIKNYGIVCKFGALTVNKRVVVLCSNGAQKTYDGTPLTKEGYFIYSGSFLEGHEPVVRITGAQTIVGTSDNTYEVDDILDADGVSVFDNYNITKKVRTLTVNIRRITIKTEPYTWPYDGDEHFYAFYRTSLTVIKPSVDSSKPSESTTSPSGEQTPSESPDSSTFQTREVQSVSGIVVGHDLQVTMSAKITDVGSVDNTIDGIKVIDSESGEDITTNYEFEQVLNKLAVTQRPITIRAGSNKKAYDGSPLTCDEYKLISGSLVKSHTLSALTSGQRTLVGESSNKIVAYTIIDSQGRDCTANYYVTTADGSLVVFDASNPPQKEGNDLDESGGLDGDEGDGRVAVVIKSENSGQVYLRYKSFGDYDKNKWGYATDYDATQSVNGYGANYLAGVALANAGYRSYKMTIEVNGSNYLLPYYPEYLPSTKLDTPQLSDTTYSGNTDYLYTCFYYDYNNISDGKINAPTLGGNFEAFESNYKKFVYDNYLTVDSETAEFLQNIINIKRFNKNDPQIVSQVAAYVQSAATYNLRYSKTLDQSPNVVIAFLQDVKEGVCRHYATAGTLLFRQLGIPARYVIGYKGMAKAGQEVTIMTKDAHAWVEIYLDGFGWVNVEVTGGSGGNNGGVKSPVIKPMDEYYKYDDMIHMHDGKLQGLTGFEAKGYTFKSTVEGTPRRMAGKSEIRIATFAAYFEGEDVTDKFLRENNIVFLTGILQVYLYEIKVTTKGGTRQYNGQPLTNDYINCEGVQSGHTLTKSVATGSIENVGVCLNMCEIRIEDSLGNDVTDEYRIIENYGELKITPIEITITANSSKKVYDVANKTPLIDDGYKISGTSGTLVEGHRAVVNIIGSQTSIGSSANKIVSVEIYDAAGVDVISNYLVHTVNGTLTVTKPTRPS